MPAYTCPTGLSSRGTRSALVLQGGALKLCAHRLKSVMVSPLESVAGQESRVARDRTLVALGSHGLRRARIWYALNMLTDNHNMLNGSALCNCIPRDPDAEIPPAYTLCARGKAQLYLLGLRARSIRALLTGVRGWRACAHWVAQRRIFTPAGARRAVFTFAYAPLASKVLNMWDCTEIAGKLYLAQDFKITCVDCVETVSVLPAC